MPNFALIGAAGYVAPRHLEAIHATGNRLVAAADPHDSVGVLDRFFPEARFFKEIERFDRFLEKERRRSDQDRVRWISICSPNYLHDAHVRLAFRVRAHALCEKPLVISPWNLDALADLEAETGCRAFSVLQLRLHPVLAALKQQIDPRTAHGKADVCLSYVTPRGPWYHVSWKGSPEKSGGIAMNIGIHFFDLLLWLFGPVEKSVVHLADSVRSAGVLELAAAQVRWFLSVDHRDLPETARGSGQASYRSLTIDGTAVEFSEGFGDLHTRVYQQTLDGHGWGIEEARPSIDLVHEIRHSPVASASGDRHPFLRS